MESGAREFRVVESECPQTRGCRAWWHGSRI